MRLCAITDRRRLAEWEGAGPAAANRLLCSLAKRWSCGGVETIQLREKDLDARELAALARSMLAAIAEGRSKLLINMASPAALEVALEMDAGGVHFPGRPAARAVEGVRRAFARAGRQAIVSMACHAVGEVAAARSLGADFVLFSPIFSKDAAKGEARRPPQGLDALRRACVAAEGMPVFALGGIAPGNAADCLAAGAAGVAGIRLFLESSAGDGLPSGPEGGWRLLRAGNHL